MADEFDEIFRALHAIHEKVTLVEDRVRKALAVSAARDKAVSLATGYNPAWKEVNGRLTEEGEKTFFAFLRAKMPINEVARRMQMTPRSVRLRAKSWMEDRQYEKFINAIRVNRGLPPMPSIPD